jgi:hypothetical protein
VVAWLFSLQLPVQSVPISTTVMSSWRDVLYAKFVSDLRHVGGFLWLLRFPPPIKRTAMT